MCDAGCDWCVADLGVCVSELGWASGSRTDVDVWTCVREG